MEHGDSSVSEYEQSDSSHESDGDEAADAKLSGTTADSVSPVYQPIVDFLNSPCVSVGFGKFCLDCEFQAFFLYYYLNIYLPQRGEPVLNLSQRWYTTNWLAKGIAASKLDVKVSRKESRVFYYGGWVSRIVLTSVSLDSSALVKAVSGKQVSKVEALESIVFFLAEARRNQGVVIPRFVSRFVKSKNHFDLEILKHCRETVDELRSEYGPWPTYPPTYLYHTDDSLESELSEEDEEQETRPSTNGVAQSPYQRKTRRKSMHAPTTGLVVDQDGFAVPDAIEKTATEQTTKLLGCNADKVKITDGRGAPLIRTIKRIMKESNNDELVSQETDIDNDKFDAWIANHETLLRSMHGYAKSKSGASVLQKLAKQTNVVRNIKRASKRKKQCSSEDDKPILDHAATKKGNKSLGYSSETNITNRVIQFPFWTFQSHSLYESQLGTDEARYLYSILTFKDHRPGIYQRILNRLNRHEMSFIAVKSAATSSTLIHQTTNRSTTNSSTALVVPDSNNQLSLIETERNSTLAELIASETVMFTIHLLVNMYLSGTDQEIARSTPSSSRQHDLVRPMKRCLQQSEVCTPTAERVHAWLLAIQAAGRVLGASESYAGNVKSRLTDKFTTAKLVLDDSSNLLDELWKTW